MSEAIIRQSMQSGFRIRSWNYDENVLWYCAREVIASLKLEAKLLARAVEQDYIEEEQRRIIFVADGVGGLIVKQALLEAQKFERSISILKYTQGTIFLDCPHFETAIQWCPYVARHVQSGELQTDRANDQQILELNLLHIRNDFLLLPAGSTYPKLCSNLYNLSDRNTICQFQPGNVYHDRFMRPLPNPCYDLFESGGAKFEPSKYFKNMLEAIQTVRAVNRRPTKWTCIFDSVSDKGMMLQDSCSHDLALKKAQWKSPSGTRFAYDEPQQLAQDSTKNSSTPVHAIRAFRNDNPGQRSESIQRFVEPAPERYTHNTHPRHLTALSKKTLLNPKAAIEQTLMSTPPQSRKLAWRIFAWVLCAVRPLEVAELSTALRVGWDLPSRTRTDEWADLAPFQNLRDSIVELCGGLVIVGRDQNVFLIHTSLESVFNTDREGLGNSESPIDRQGAEELLALTSLKCLTWQLENQDSDTDKRGPQATIYDTPEGLRFTEYATDHWALHCCLAEAGSWYIVGALEDYLQHSLVGVDQPNLADNQVRSCLRERQDFRNAVLCQCARYGFTQLGTIYIEMGTDLDGTNDLEAKSPLVLALNHQRWDMAVILMEKGASLRLDYGADNGSLLHYAAASGRTDIVSFLLRRGVNPNMVTTTAETVLHWAVIHDQPHAVKNLIRGGSDANRSTELTRETPLHWAAMFGHEEVLRKLLDVADLTVKSCIQWTALHYAAAYGHLGAVELLIQRGANTATETPSGVTALHLATEYGHDCVIRVLCSYSVGKPYPVHHRDSFQRDPSVPNTFLDPTFDLSVLTINEQDTMNLYIRAST